MNNFYISGSQHGIYQTRRFTDIFPSLEEFLAAYQNGMIPETISVDSASTLFYLLYARYGNSHIANTIDENQWIAQVMAIIFQFGPSWEKRLEVQEKIRNWTEDEILIGATDIYNTSLNPSSGPVNDSREALKTVNQQNASMRTKDKMSAYAYLLSLLETDVTEDFISKFRNLFITIINPVGTLLYPTYDEEEN